MTRNVSGIEKALDEYLRDGEDQGEFATGWILIAAISSSRLDQIGHNGYINVTSEGLPHHAQLGLMTMALQDKQAGATAVSLYNIGDAIFEEEWDEEDND